MERDINVDNSAALLYDQYLVPEFEIPAQQISSGVSVVSINGIGGPTVTFVGGTSGFSYAPSGATVIIVSPLTTKGDVYTHSGAAGVRLGVGTNGQVLTADSAATNGIKWAAAASASSLPLLASVSFNVNTNTKQTLYTVTSGKSAIVTAVVLSAPSVDMTAGATTVINFGFNAGATDWSSTAAYPLAASNLRAATRYSVYSQETSGGTSGCSTIGTSAQVFGAICDAAYGSAATMTISVLGYEY